MLEIFIEKAGKTRFEQPKRIYFASLEVDPGEVKEFKVEGIGLVRTDLSEVNGRLNGEHVVKLDIPMIGPKEISVNRRTGEGMNAIGTGLRLGAELPGWKIVRTRVEEPKV